MRKAPECLEHAQYMLTSIIAICSASFLSHYALSATFEAQPPDSNCLQIPDQHPRSDWHPCVTAIPLSRSVQYHLDWFKPTKRQLVSIMLLRLSATAARACSAVARCGSSVCRPQVLTRTHAVASNVPKASQQTLLPAVQYASDQQQRRSNHCRCACFWRLW